MIECIKDNCYYWQSGTLLDDVLEYFQENNYTRAKHFEQWRKDRAAESEEPAAQSGEAPVQQLKAAIALVRELSGLLLASDRERFLLSLTALETAATSAV